jgi:hypothetical protein
VSGLVQGLDSRQQEESECVGPVSQTMKAAQDRHEERLFGDGAYLWLLPGGICRTSGPGLDRKELVGEMAGIQERLSALVLYLDDLEGRSVLVEAWHVLDKLRPSEQGR